MVVNPPISCVIDVSINVCLSADISVIRSLPLDNQYFLTLPVNPSSFGNPRIPCESFISPVVDMPNPTHPLSELTSMRAHSRPLLAVDGLEGTIV